MTRAARRRPAWRLLLPLLAALLPGGRAAAQPEGPAPGLCRQITFEGEGYAVCTLPPAADLRLWLRMPEGSGLGGPVGTFERLRGLVAAEGGQLGFAMNAGMYHSDRRPVGLYVEQGSESHGLVTAPGPGNFGMTPNGVFCVTEDGFRVIESLRFADERPACRFATQSGPMLVIGGELHPRFLPDSESRHIRNGIGVRADGQAVAVISDRPVTFHAFARLFRDALDSPDALYLDGSISRLYAPDLGRNDPGFPMGPILGVVLPPAPEQGAAMAPPGAAEGDANDG